MRHSVLQSSLIKIVIAILIALILVTDTSTLGSSVFQSKLPGPSKNPFFVVAGNGGRIFCGAQQSPVWLQIPSGFTGEGGAEIHCDPVRSSSALPAAKAWDGQIYLVGIYTPQLLKPITAVFEIDRARLNSVCANCWSAEYYDAANKRWRKLPTTFDANNARVYATVTTILPASRYPNYADRFAIALFTQTQQTTATVTKVSKPSPTPTLTASVAPATAIPVQSQTNTPSSVAATSEPVPAPTASTTSNQPAPAPTASTTSNQPAPATSDNLTFLIGLSVIGWSIAIAVIIILVRRRRPH